MFRVEDKYLLPENDYFELQERLGAILDSDNHAPSMEGYSVSSLYFDDMIDTDYYDTISGHPVRKKHRIRIYNSSLASIKLEVKEKCYGRIKKSSCHITSDQLLALMHGETIEWGKTWDDPRSLFNEGVLTRKLKPKVIVTYERKAFVYERGNTRITFDRNIRASNDVESFGVRMPVCDYPDGVDYVLEVKYDEFIPDFVLQTLEIDSAELLSYSKYGLCRAIYKK